MHSAAVPFFRPSITDAEIAEVVDALRSGWLTTGPRTSRFETEFARAVGAPHAVALNSCTAALHLAVEALGLSPGQAVLVPTMTFAATAEVVCYRGAIPLLVDCDPVTLNMDLADAERKIDLWRRASLPCPGRRRGDVVGIMPVHVGGLMMNVDAIRGFAARHALWVVEDAAHAFPAAWRRDAASPWQRCGEDTADVTCFSFYANKTITTGEGGMAVTASGQLAARIRSLSLHGLSEDAWSRYSGGRNWDYRILAPGYKYNLTDLAAAIGLQQLARAEAMRRQREGLAAGYRAALGTLEEIELPVEPADRVHAWHLFPIRCRPGRLAIARNAVIDALKAHGVGCSVHWRPLHLHPYYRDTFGWQPGQCPVASTVWERLVSLPLFPDLSPADVGRVVSAVTAVCRAHRRPAPARVGPAAFLEASR